MALYHGRKGRVYISDSGTGTAVAVANLKSWSLDMATDKVEVTSFGDDNKTYVQGLKDLKGSFAGFFNSADDSVFTAADSSDGSNIYLYPSLDIGGDGSEAYWYGQAFMDCSIECAVDAAVSISANFVAAGSWGRVLPS